MSLTSLFSPDHLSPKKHCWPGERALLATTLIRLTLSSRLRRNEVDIKGHDGVIYKGRISVDKLPSVDLHKKNSVVLLAPPPLVRSRSESQPISSHHQQRESPGNEQERNGLSPLFPNLEPIVPREESFT